MDTEKMKRFIAVAGPTASGKSALALQLCRQLDGEFISCDSMQIYRGMDIGTAKPTPAEMAEIPHHLIDILDPDQSFSAADYQPLAENAVENILSRGKMPIFCGGTGLYLDVVITGNAFSAGDTDTALRQQLTDMDPALLYRRLQEIDPQAAAAIHPNNHKRVVRAVEIYETTGMTKTEWDARSRTTPSEFRGKVLVLDHTDRDELYRRINDRVDQMMAAGLADEVRALHLPPDSTAAQAIGYKELIACFQGKMTLDEAVEKIKTATRNYAKRQLTWFRRKPYSIMLPVEKGQSFKDIVNNALKVLTD